MKRALAVFLTVLLLASALTGAALAAGQITVLDDADLLSPAEEATLISRYEELAAYVDTAFVSTEEPGGSTPDFAERMAIQLYGNDPAVLFVIDMRNRQIYVYANGSAQRFITKADARAVTDNAYKSASQGDYFACADDVFGQILAKSQGQKLARPVKHITNLLIAMLFGVLINYLITASSRRPRAERRTEGSVTAAVAPHKALLPGLMLAAPIVIGSVRRYKESSSGGGGGGGGGGGHSGGGGGHSF